MWVMHIFNALYSLYFGKEGWVVVDGDGTKSSKNGTWYNIQYYNVGFMLMSSS